MSTVKGVSAFRYSGNKLRMLKHLRGVPSGVTRIVEPFCGSCAFSLNSGLPFKGYDVAREVIELLRWLRDSDLDAVNALASYCGVRADVRGLPIEPVAMTYLRINCASVMTGQLSSWTLYPQHRLPVLTDVCQAALRRGRFILGDARSVRVRTGDMLFVDPPYHGTHGNYAAEGDVREVVDAVVRKSRGECWVTYGDGAPSVFPRYPWTRLCVRRVPNIRRGGVVERTEWVAYLSG